MIKLITTTPNFYHQRRRGLAVVCITTVVVVIVITIIIKIQNDNINVFIQKMHSNYTGMFNEGCLNIIDCTILI